MRRGDPQLRFRAASADDALAMAELSLRAYPRNGDSAASRAQAYGQSVWFSPPDYTLALRTGVPGHVGQFLTLPFGASFGGVRASAGGLASVATAPEARRTGVASAMVARHLDQLAEHDVAWALLYPYSPRFYATQGWAPMARLLRWHLTPTELPLCPERARVRTLSPSDASDLGRIQRAYERHCGRENGSLSRTPRQLAARLKTSHVVGVQGDHVTDELSGYMIYELRSPTPHPLTMVVHELVAEDAAATRALAGFLAAQDAQVEQLELDLPEHHALPALMNRGLPPLEDPVHMPNEHHLVARLFTGAMVRVVHLARALEGRGYPGLAALTPGLPAAPASGRISVVASDALLPHNQQPITLSVDAGSARISPGHSPGVPLLSGPIATLSAVLAGALRLATAVHLGQLTLEAGARLHELDALLALPPPAPLITF